MGADLSRAVLQGQGAQGQTAPVRTRVGAGIVKVFLLRGEQRGLGAVLALPKGVAAVVALAEVGAGDARLEALTVILQTLRLAAVAALEVMLVGHSFCAEALLGHLVN